MNAIILTSDVVDHARRAADTGEPVQACPYPDGSVLAARWRLAYFAREMELLAEIEA